MNPGVLYQFNAAAAEELKKDMAVIQAKRAEKPVEDFISVLTEPAGAPPVTNIFHRGDHRQPTSVVKPADLTIASPVGQRFTILRSTDMQNWTNVQEFISSESSTVLSDDVNGSSGFYRVIAQ